MQITVQENFQIWFAYTSQYLRVWSDSDKDVYLIVLERVTLPGMIYRKATILSVGESLQPSPQKS